MTEPKELWGFTDVARALNVPSQNLDRDHPNLPPHVAYRPGKGRFWDPDDIRAYAKRLVAEKQEAKT